ncbi:unnamed protein product [Urochloa humidicola]
MSMFSYEILIHLDCVEDYSPQPSNPSGSYESDTSGLPGDDPMVQWPARHYYTWHFGQPDALPDPPRAPVHTRLGGRRDRSPPRGGGAGGAGGGLRQIPPPSRFDIARSMFGQGAGAGGSGRRGEGGHSTFFRGHTHGDTAGRGRRELMWKPKKKMDGKSTEGGEEKLQEQERSDRVDDAASLEDGATFHFDEKCHIGSQEVDPMSDKAEQPSKRWDTVEDQQAKRSSEQWGKNAAGTQSVGRQDSDGDTLQFESASSVEISAPQPPHDISEMIGANRAVVTDGCVHGMGHTDNGVEQHKIMIDDKMVTMEEAEDKDTPAMTKGEMVMSKEQREFDPTLEVAVAPHVRPNAPQRSVEPTAANGATTVTHSPQPQSLDATDSMVTATEADAQRLSQLLQIGGIEESLGGKELWAEKIGPNQDQLSNSDVGFPFDLNQDIAGSTKCDATAQHVETHFLEGTKRTILGTAEGRLNKNDKEAPAHKVAPRTVARFAVPLKKALLCNPMMKPKAPSTKKSVQANALPEKKMASTVSIKKSNVPLEDQATALLMKATGVIAESDCITEEAQQAFSEQFINHLNEEPIQDIRIALNLPGLGRADVLGALISESGVADD